ncbi:MAG: hypothetical protein ACSLFA_04325 [Mycobacterium sp.]
MVQPVRVGDVLHIRFTYSRSCRLMRRNVCRFNEFDANLLAEPHALPGRSTSATFQEFAENQQLHGVCGITNATGALARIADQCAIHQWQLDFARQSNTVFTWC